MEHIRANRHRLSALGFAMKPCGHLPGQHTGDVRLNVHIVDHAQPIAAIDRESNVAGIAALRGPLSSVMVREANDRAWFGNNIKHAASQDSIPEQDAPLRVNSDSYPCQLAAA